MGTGQSSDPCPILLARLKAMQDQAKRLERETRELEREEHLRQNLVANLVSVPWRRVFTSDSPGSRCLCQADQANILRE